MRRHQQSIPLAAAGTQAVTLLAGLLAGTPQVPALDLARALVQAALHRVSLFSSTLWSLAVGPEATRRCLRNNLDRIATRDPDRLLRATPLSRGRRRAPRIVAVDWHERPYYGNRKTAGIRGGQAKASTRHFWTYATLTVEHRGHTLTLAVEPMPKGTTPAQAVARLLDRAGETGLKIRVLLLDRGFYSADLIGELQRRRVPFLLPAIRRGTAATGTRPFFRPGPSRYATHTWQPRYRRNGRHCRGPDLTVVLAIVARSDPAKEPLVFATDSKRRPPASLAALYRRRFAIETTYRLLHRVEAKTTSNDRRRRLLLIVIGFLLVNLWVLSRTPKRPGRTNDDPTASRTWCRFLQQLLRYLGDFDATAKPKPRKPAQTT